MHRKPEPKAAAQLLAQAFAAQGVEMKHQAALNLLATLEGYESYAHMKAAQVASQVAVPAESEPGKFTVRFLFGEEEVRGYHEASDEEDEEELANWLGQAKEFTFGTKQELDAFLQGVDEACGWLECLDVTDLTT